MTSSKVDACVMVFGLTVALVVTGCRKPPPIIADHQPDTPSSVEPTSEHAHRNDDSIAIIQWPAKVKAKPLRSSVKSAVDYLVRTTDEQGQFAYSVNVDPNVPATDEYNVVRHAGTMYSLGMYLERYDEDAAAVREALLRQGAFLRKHVEAVDGQEGMLAIWSDPSLTGLAGPRRAKLGSAALGLIGLLCAERESPGSVPRELLHGLAEFILFMQDEDGSFAARYVPDEQGKQYVPVLLYYPGESALALVMLYEMDGDEKWLQAAAKAMAHMAQRRDQTGRPVLDHWMLLACGRMWPHYDKTTQPATREHLIRYSIELCKRLMRDSRRRTPGSRFKGCITCDGRTCPTATRVEGMLSALAYLPEDEAVFRAKVQRVSEDSIHFLMASQIEEGNYRGGIPYTMLDLPEAHPWRRNKYDNKAGEIRIDYLQHAIGAMMLYDDVVLSQ